MNGCMVQSVAHLEARAAGAVARAAGSLRPHLPAAPGAVQLCLIADRAGMHGMLGEILWHLTCVQGMHAADVAGGK